jgi:hypothetical protein
MYLQDVTGFQACPFHASVMASEDALLFTGYLKGRNFTAGNTQARVL